MTMDNSNFAAPTTPQWAGGNTGGGGPGDYTLFNTSDLSLYRVSFDAHVLGLAPDVVSTSGEGLQLFINAPDDTLQPADGDTANDTLIRLDFAINDLATNWQHYAYLLSKGGVGGGSKANFTNYFNKINEVSLQFQILNAASSDWSYDTDNSLVVDNFKVERLVVGCPALQINTSGSNIVLTWGAPSTGTAKLQSATTLGSWSDVPGATSGYTIPAANAPKYFRTEWVPPAQ